MKGKICCSLFNKKYYDKTGKILLEKFTEHVDKIGTKNYFSISGQICKCQCHWDQSKIKHKEANK